MRELNRYVNISWGCPLRHQFYNPETGDLNPSIAGASQRHGLSGGPATGILLRFLLTAIAVMLVALQTQNSFSQTEQEAQSVAVKQVATNVQGFGIPFEVDPNDKSIIEVQLYLSLDRGQTWTFYGRQSPQQNSFPFQADGDGDYWFALKTLNRDRQLIPEGKVQPQLIIKVDTKQPELDFRIQTDAAGRVVCRWRAYDKNLDPRSIKILYQPVRPGETNWSQVPIELQGTARNGLYSDQLAWWPDTDETSLLVRLAIADTAGNTIAADRQVMIPGNPWRHQKSGTTFPVNTAQQSSGTAETPDSNGLEDQVAAQPDGVVCDNGVCYRKPAVTASPVAMSTEVRPKTLLPKAEIQRLASTGRLIGGPPEFSDPPVPDELTQPPAQAPVQHRMPRQLSASPGISSQGSGNVWQSEPERWITEHRQITSSTLDRRNQGQRVASPFAKTNNPRPTSANRKRLPPSNPASMKTMGDQVVSESSTMYPSNQYQGPKTVEAMADATKARLMPRQETESESGSSAAGTRRKDNLAYHSPIQGRRIADGQTSKVAQPDRGAFKKANYQDSRQSVMREPMANVPEESATQTIGSKRFRLNYGIDAIDPSGVSQVDLWMTRDGGGTWNTWGKDSDNASPFPVEVENEGLYGFRIVVHSKDGLTGRGPSSGDKPDIWVRVDTQSPLAQITSVPYGRGDEAGRLVINYSVADDHLVLRPVTLSFSERHDGPWIAIEEGLRNEGRYVWKPDSNVPDRIFLRLDARDRAGNMGVHILNQPIDVSGLVPRGTIHGVVPVGQ